MFRPRIIPVLLLKGVGLVKTVGFKNPRYIGDPINAVHIFNDLKADELVFLDIAASPEKRKPDLDLIRKISDEAYMPFAFGGNISTIEDAKNCFKAGAEKIVINTAAVNNHHLVREITDTYGKQSVIVSIDVKKTWRKGIQVISNCGKVKTGLDPLKHAVSMSEQGAGELMINSIDRDGMMEGYDLELIKKITDVVNIPVIGCGGAGNTNHLKEVISKAGASAAAAGSMFVYHGARKGILINYPSNRELLNLFNQ